MHLVVKNHLADFSKKHAIEKKEEKQFEAFLNYVIFRSYCAENVDPNELIYDGDDPGIDGIMIFINDSYVSSVEEVEDAMSGRKRDTDVTITLTQAKTSETWSKSEINVFESAISDFFSTEKVYPQSDYLTNAREVFNSILKHVGKIRNGKPSIHTYFATTAQASDAREIVAAKDAIKNSLSNIGYFDSIESTLVNRDSIVEMWTAAEGQVEATLRVLGSAAFPRTEGIEEGYAVTVTARDFINQILIDKNGRLRQQIFEENVRDFLGLEGDVNKEMTETIENQKKQKRFGILNNGITMISPDIRVSGFDIFIRDFQIVNGCQTSNVLFENRAKIDEEATIMLKIIETANPEVVDDIVRSTNRQAKVDEEQFLATLDAVKSLERYFEARGQDEDLCLYFERRKNQFSSQENIKAIRVFDIKEIARCVAAMFLDKPDIASRYPNRLTSEMKNLVFNSNYKEEVYYVAAYTLYRLRLLIGNNKIDQRYSKLRWHIIMAIKYYVLGDKIPNLNSQKITKSCEAIEKFMSSGDDETLAKIKSLCARIIDIDEINRDKLKSGTLAHELKVKAIAFKEE